MGSSTLVSLMQRLPKLSLVFYIIILLLLETLCRIVIFLVTVETSDMIIKRRSLVPDLVTCYSRDAQCE